MKTQNKITTPNNALIAIGQLIEYVTLERSKAAEDEKERLLKAEIALQAAFDLIDDINIR